MQDDVLPSDLDIEELSPDQLDYGWSLLIDLRSEFQGSALGFALFSVLAPVFGVIALVFEWVDREPIAYLGILAGLTVACVSVALHSWYWYVRLCRRIRMVERHWKRKEALNGT